MANLRILMVFSVKSMCTGVPCGPIASADSSVRIIQFITPKRHLHERHLSQRISYRVDMNVHQSQKVNDHLR